MNPSLFGIDVIVSPLLPEFAPVLELRLDAPVTDQFRAEFNAWLRDMFGQRRQFYMVMGKYAMHPNNMQFLKMQLNASVPA